MVNIIRLNKRAQMKIQQMSFMIIAVLIFFVLVGMVIFVVRINGLKKTATGIQQEDALYLASKVANSPEFTCGNAFGTQKSACVDMDKIMALKENINDYGNFWGISNIEIIRTYPTDYNNITCSSSNYPNCGIIQLYDKPISGSDVSNYVSLCRKVYSEGTVKDKCDVGKILVSYEKK